MNAEGGQLHRTVSLKRTLTRAASKFLVGNRIDHKVSYWRDENDTLNESESDTDQDEPWWMQDALWEVDIDIPEFDPPSYDEAMAHNGTITLTHETPELNPPPKYDLSLTVDNRPGFSQDNALTDEQLAAAALGQQSMVEGTPTKELSYKGRGRGRGRSRILRQLTLAKSGNTGTEDMIALEDYGVGPLGRAMDATKKGAKLKKKPPSGRPRVKMQSKPYFITIVSIINAILIIWEIVLGGGILPFEQNPFLGPPPSVLVMFGAKWVDAIKNQGEWWRFFTAMFLHGGLVHAAFNLMSQITMGVKLERVHGTFRVMPIYIISGLVGNLMSAFFLPQAATVGASGAIFGMFGVLLVDLIKNWKKINNPCKSCMGLVCGLVVSFVFGLMPGVDQWAHAGGFVAGILAGIVFLPSMHIGKWNIKRRILQVAITFPLLIGSIVALFVVFYMVDQDVNEWCPNCKYVTCLPIFDACKGLQSSS